MLFEGRNISNKFYHFPLFSLKAIEIMSNRIFNILLMLPIYIFIRPEHFRIQNRENKQL